MTEANIIDSIVNGQGVNLALTEDGMKCLIKILEREIQDLKQMLYGSRIYESMKVIQWYADEKNYNGSELKSSSILDRPILHDRGKQAREFLEKYPEFKGV